METEKTLKAYKGFDKDLRCRDFQYEVGKEYEIDGNIKCCKHGFHACESPIEVLGHYLLDEECNLARFCEVEQSGDIDREYGTTKVASSKISIKAELTLAGLIKAGIERIKSTVKDVRGDNGRDDARIGSSGSYAQIGSNGDDARIGSSGDDAQIGSNGDNARIGSNGDDARIGSSGDDARIGSNGDNARIGSSGSYAQIGSSGDDARIGSSGHNAQIGSSGDDARIGSSGHNAQIGSSGDDARIGSSGDDARIGSSGDDARIGSSGDDARIGSSGHNAQIGSSGSYAQIGSSGSYARIGSSGDDAQIGSSGDNAVIMCAGNDSMAKAKKGSWITLSEWKYSSKIGRTIPICVKTEQVDGERIKEDTFYKLVDGEFTEVKLGE